MLWVVLCCGLMFFEVYAGTALRKPIEEKCVVAYDQVCFQGKKKWGSLYAWYTLQNHHNLNERHFKYFFDNTSSIVQIDDIVKTLIYAYGNQGEESAQCLFFYLITNEALLKNQKLFNELCGYFLQASDATDFSCYVPVSGFNYFFHKRPSVVRCSEVLFVNYVTCYLDSSHPWETVWPSNCCRYNVVHVLKEHFEDWFYAIPYEMKLDVVPYAILYTCLVHGFAREILGYQAQWFRFAGHTKFSIFGYDLLQPAQKLRMLVAEKKTISADMLLEYDKNGKRQLLSLFLEYASYQFFHKKIIIWYKLFLLAYQGMYMVFFISVRL